MMILTGDGRLGTERESNSAGANSARFRRSALVAPVAGGGVLNVLLALFPGAPLFLALAALALAALAGFCIAFAAGESAGWTAPEIDFRAWAGRHLLWWAGALAAYGFVLGRVLLDAEQGAVDLAVWAVGMALVAAPVVRGAGPVARFRPTTLRRDVPLVLGLTALVVVLHAHDLREWRYAVVGDEMLFFQRALETVRRGIHEPFIIDGVYYNSPMLNSVYQALFVWLAPDDGWGWKFSSVMSVALTVPPMYMLGMRFGGVQAGVLAAAAAASGHYALAFTHIGYTHLDALPVIAWGLLAFSSALRTKSAPLTLLSGLLMGLSLYTALPARALAVVAIVWIATSVRGWRDIRALWPIAVGFAAAAAPFVAENGPETVRVMGRDTMSPYSVYASEIGDPLSRFLGNFDNLLVWWHNPDRISHYTSGPLLDYVTGALAAAGLGTALWFWRSRHRFVLLWLAVALIPTALLAPYPQSPLTRMHGALLPLALLAAMALGCFLSRFRIPQPGRWTVVILTVAILVGLNQWRFQYVTFQMTEHHMAESMAIGAWESKMCGTGADALFVGRDGDLLEKVLASYGSVRELPAVVDYGAPRVYGNMRGCRIFFRPDDAAAQDALERLDGDWMSFENPSGRSWVGIVLPGFRIERRGGDEVY